MPTKKSEKVKLYLVVALAAVAVLIAYFTFVHNGKDAPVKAAGLPQPVVKVDLKKIEKPRLQGPENVRIPSDAYLNLEIRDIFTAAALSPEPEVKKKKKRAVRKTVRPIPPPAVNLDLQGTIIGGRKPMAIINNKFLGVGEKIGDYQIVAIAPNTVHLKAGPHKKVIRVLNPAQN
jgi:hypothetical protein